MASKKKCRQYRVKYLAFVDENLQEELIELKCNDECNYKFEKRGITEKWLSNTTEQLYPKMWSEMVKILLYFPTSYLVECGFSAVKKILTKESNKIDVCIRGDTRLKLTNFKPNVEGLMAKHQLQGSH